MTGAWIVPTVADKYGGSFLRSQQASPAATANMSELPTAANAPTGGGVLSAIHPSTGLFALGVVAAISFGLMAFSTTVRVGHADAHVGVGKT